MIKTTILKVSHGGITEAKKLLPYIRKADLYSPESAARDEVSARRFESAWLKKLETDFTIEQLRDEIDSLGHNEGEIKEYEIYSDEQALKYKVPIWFLERFSPEKGEDILRMHEEAIKARNLSINYLWAGQPRIYLEFIKGSLEMELVAAELRDKEIARNLNELETKVRDVFFTQFQLNPSINHVMYVGQQHNPEKYVSESIRPNIEVVSLVDKSNRSLFEDIDNEKALLAFGMKMVERRGKYDPKKYPLPKVNL